MVKKTIIVFLVSLALTSVHLVEAQQPKKVPRIGFMSATGDPQTPGAQLAAFRQGLRNLGYIEGKNIHVEYRDAEGNQDRIPGLVAELVQLNEYPRRRKLWNLIPYVGSRFTCKTWVGQKVSTSLSFS
jgi:putative ABC transport system substrate-binding protein